MAVTTIKALITAARVIDQALTQASSESATHAAAAAAAAGPAVPTGQLAPNSGR